MSEPITIMDEIADMTSVKGEYIRLMSVAISDGIEEVLNRIKETTDKPLDKIILETAIKCYEISNADFQDNFNPHHREEQPF